MSRYLFVVPPLTGHINPTVGVGGELADRGHEVAWVGHPATLRALLPEGARILPALDDELERGIQDAREHWLRLRGMAVLKFFWQDFLLPLGRAMVPGVEAAVRDFAPDVVVADQQALAGPLVADRAGIPWVTSASTPAELFHPLRSLPKVDDWVRAQLDDLVLEFVGRPTPDIRFSERLVLAFTSSALVGDGFPDHYKFTGPVLGHRPDRVDFPWDWLVEGRRRVLVSLGTLNGPAGERFFAEVAEAVADLRDVQVVVVAPPGAVDESPEHVLRVDRVPQLALMPHLDAVVSHGGHNTVCEALAHGLPLVVAPIRDDQPLIAEQVVAAGAGIRLTYSRVRAAQIRAALEDVLHRPCYADAARRVQQSFQAAGGAPTAADHLEAVVA